MSAAALLVLAGVLAGATAAGAQSASARRGAAVVEQWCRLCHQQANDRPKPDMAPPFEEIVRRPGRDRAWLERFIRQDHFPMTTFRLFDDEKADVVGWLVWLQQSRQPASPRR